MKRCGQRAVLVWALSWLAACAPMKRAAVALGLREKELGVLVPVIGLGGIMTGTDDLGRFVTGEPSLAAYASWLELLAGLPNKIKGKPGDVEPGGRTFEAQLDWVNARVQILSVQATKATCQYNGAAGFHNAGVFERALDLARLAAAHPAFADKAAELIELIRKR